MANPPIPNFNSKLYQKSRIDQLVADARAKIEASKNGPPEISEPVKPISVDREDIIKKHRHELVEKMKALQDEQQAKMVEEIATAELYAPQMLWNEEQQLAIDKGLAGESFNLIGKAGTGKTTVTRQIIKQILATGRIGPMKEDTKYLRRGLPGVAVVSFTNRAVKNIAKGMSGDMKQHTVTLHKLLEFAPEFMEIVQANGEIKNIRKFLPKRNKFNPLPNSLRLIVFEESSMISAELFGMLTDALKHDVQFIFLGDLQQLPPVYGSAILGFKLLELPTVELTKIYRQAEGSPIINLAWKIASGVRIAAADFEEITKSSEGKIVLRPWKKRLDSEDACFMMGKLFKQFIDQGIYDQEQDMIMIPFNKKFGTTEFNKDLAQHLGKKRGATIYEIIAGFNKYYYAVGDKILVDRMEGIIEEIKINAQYVGASPMPASPDLNRWGMYESPGAKEEHEQSLEEIEQFLLLQQTKQDGENEEAKQQGSHILVCRLIDSEEIREVRTTGEYSATTFAYALTVHKCQGSEWRKCFLLLHKSHAVMISRELLYTAVTRAKEELYIICEPDSLEKGVKNQRIKGNTIAEKAEYFKGKLEREDD
jgi:exodeoxyribonuclease V alpha subunit